MDRRKTLAGLSPSHANSRASLAPGRVIMEAKTAGAWTGSAAGKLPLDKALARMSLAGPVQRRSSAYTTTKAASGLKTDPRPVGDKAYQQNCIRTVITFLATHGYEHQVTPKVLASPTTKDFTNVMLFLVRQLDANLLKGFGKLEEEVPQLYKRLRYPFQISKSNLTAVGSPHTWPTILAAVTWAVELLNYSNRAEALRQGVADDRSHAEAEFFDYVATSYHHFMAGDDDRCEAVDAEKAAEFQQRAGGIQDSADSLRAANDALRAQIDELRRQPRPLMAARERHAETLADKDKFCKLLDNLAAHRSSLQRKVVERQADVNAQAAELAGVEADNDQLRGRVAAQTLHPADVVRMNQDRAKQDAALRMLCQQREAGQARVAQQEAMVEARVDELEAQLAEYHARADRLQLIPASAKRAEGVGFEVRLERGAASAGEMVCVDLKGIIKPALQRLKDGYAARARELSEEALSLAEKSDAAGEVVAERAEENANAEAQVRELEAQYRSGKEALEAEVAAALAQVEGLAAAVTTLRGAAAAGVTESEERLRSLHADYEELQRACELDNATLHRDLAAALEAVLNHKMAVQAKLKSSAGRVGRAVDDVWAAPLPGLAVE